MMNKKPMHRRGPGGLPRRETIPKVTWKAGTMLCPVPVVLVTSITKEGKPNVCTVAWAGTVCSEPPMLSISLRKTRYTYDLILAAKEFVVNVPTVDLIRATDYCGVASGRDTDKFKAAKLTLGPASKIRTPIIMECPINIECVVRRVLDLGVHTMFVAEIKAVQATETLLTKSGRFAIEQAGLAAFAHGSYYALGQKLGFFGFSVQKRKKKRPR